MPAQGQLFPRRNGGLTTGQVAQLIARHLDNEYDDDLGVLYSATVKDGALHFTLGDAIDPTIKARYRLSIEQLG